MILQALLTLLTRSAGKLLNTAFGWATVMLFGRVSKDRQIYLSVIAFGSVLWIVALISLAAPGFGTFLLTFVTLPKWVDKRLIRLAMMAAVLVIPALVGLVSLRMLEPGARPRGAAAKVVTVLRGYPYTVGLAITLVLMTVFAPALRVRNLARRWETQHVPMLVKPDDYLTVVEEVQAALRTGGIPTTRATVTWMLRLPTKCSSARRCSRRQRSCVAACRAPRARPRLFAAWPATLSRAGYPTTFYVAVASRTRRVAESPLPRDSLRRQ